VNLPILMYHKLQARPDPGSDLAVTPEAFRAQLERLKRSGYRSVSLSALVRGGAGLPGRPVVITFDDAYGSVLALAKPLLDAAGFTATVFAVSRAVGKHNFWDDGQGAPPVPCLDRTALRALAQAGWEIGSHGATHADLTALDERALRAELEDSKCELEKLLGGPVTALSYPFGAWNPAVRAAAARAGYMAACAISPGTASVTADPLALRRVYVKPTDSMDDFRRKTSGWYLAYRSWVRR
jgi:peptidoglycan/xylan/chitin deacetylase (PgdA/CDA1 family)